MISKIKLKLENTNKAVKASFWFVICGFMQKGISVLTTPIFTRLLDNEQFGLYSIFNSWLEIVTVLVTFRIYNGIYMKGLITYENDKDRFTSSLIGLVTFLIIIGFSVYLFFREPINNFMGLSTTMVLCMFSLILTDSWFNFWSVKQRVDLNYKKLIIITLLITVLKPLFGIVAVICSSSNKALARIISLTIVEFVVYIWLHLSQIRKSHVFFNKQYWLTAIKFNIILVPHYLSERVLSLSDRLMISNFIGNAAAGIYSLAYNLAMVMVLFNTAIINTFTPWNYKQLKVNNYAKIKKISLIAVFTIAFVNVCLILIAPEALAFFAPASYFDALYVIPPVSMGIYFIFLYGIFVSAEMYFNKTNYVMAASFTGAILNLILNYIFIPKIGYNAAAYTTLICYIICSFVHFMFLLKIQKREKIIEGIYNYKHLGLVSLIFLCIGFLLMATYRVAFVRYGCILLTALLILVFHKKIFEKINEMLNLKKD